MLSERGRIKKALNCRSSQGHVFQWFFNSNVLYLPTLQYICDSIENEFDEKPIYRVYLILIRGKYKTAAQIRVMFCDFKSMSILTICSGIVEL